MRPGPGAQAGEPARCVLLGVRCSGGVDSVDSDKMQKLFLSLA
jgi:hypothetical protein